MSQRSCAGTETPYLRRSKKESGWTKLRHSSLRLTKPPSPLESPEPFLVYVSGRRIQSWPVREWIDLETEIVSRQQWPMCLCLYPHRRPGGVFSAGGRLTTLQFVGCTSLPAVMLLPKLYRQTQAVCTSAAVGERCRPTRNSFGIIN